MLGKTLWPLVGWRAVTLSRAGCRSVTVTMVSVELLSQDFTTARGEVSVYFVDSRSIFPMHSLPMICFTTAKINVYEPFGLNSFINTMSLCSTAPRISKSSGLR